MSWVTFGQVLVLMVLGILLLNTSVDNVISHWWKEKLKAAEQYENGKSTNVQDQ
jgi:hypothetical protein